ncbi:acetoacetate decarboxylase family protein [Pseudomaricurvus alkylphenolicus]|uniref:acetoacetate decarboxylase family protein n=1 Tax=Pseudomaricurvus alkylphenolicus TaxID=1306991 RepID=UPI00141DB0E7|nr:acetoacetate decarboxylase family protein [Pseudomaricurvus alkylphenolicus]NIB40280.1 acetoacetate decarboxylase family protein [Pseudomaricurvus alkylphenolicus]
MTEQLPLGGPQGNTGDIANWPLLKVIYKTDADKIAQLLPPGIEVTDEPNVHVTFFNVPTFDLPEYGVLVTVNASYNGVDGEYALGYGIDQESVVLISQNMNGQPKYLCKTTFYRLGNKVVARCSHQGYTFLEFTGEATAVAEHVPESDNHEWWIKVSRAVSVDAVSGGYDFPPHVVDVRTRQGTQHREEVKGQLKLMDSPWDPIARLLPMREQLSAHLEWPIFKEREIKLAGALDPVAFEPYVDVISGSRWPGLIPE